MGRSKLSDEDRIQIRKLADEGVPFSKLANQFDVSFNTIKRVCRPDVYEAHKAAAKEYQGRNIQQIYRSRKAVSKRYPLNFHIINDAAIIAHLDQQDNVQGYIRTLVEKDIKDTQFESTKNNE